MVLLYIAEYNLRWISIRGTVRAVFVEIRSENLGILPNVTKIYCLASLLQQ